METEAKPQQEPPHGTAEVQNSATKSSHHQVKGWNINVNRIQDSHEHELNDAEA